MIPFVFCIAATAAAYTSPMMVGRPVLFVVAWVVNHPHHHYDYDDNVMVD
jgi:hypothetical protein